MHAFTVVWFGSSSQTDANAHKRIFYLLTMNGVLAAEIDAFICNRQQPVDGPNVKNKRRKKNRKTIDELQTRIHAKNWSNQHILVFELSFFLMRFIVRCGNWFNNFIFFRDLNAHTKFHTNTNAFSSISFSILIFPVKMKLLASVLSTIGFNFCDDFSCWGENKFASKLLEFGFCRWDDQMWNNQLHV